jgi:hypothetical protein
MNDDAGLNNQKADCDEQTLPPPSAEATLFDYLHHLSITARANVSDTFKLAQAELQLSLRALSLALLSLIFFAISVTAVWLLIGLALAYWAYSADVAIPIIIIGFVGIQAVLVIGLWRQTQYFLTLAGFKQTINVLSSKSNNPPSQQPVE